MPKPIPPEMAQVFHAYQIALDADRLPVWVMVVLGIVTVGTGLAFEASRFKQKRKVMVGFRSGVLLGLLASSLATGVLAYASWRSLTSGAVKCLSRHCHGFDFTDQLGRRHLASDHFVSMTFQPLGFWFSYAEISLFAAIALFALSGCLRSAAHWRELD